jgi:hypothetical protein
VAAMVAGFLSWHLLSAAPWFVKDLGIALIYVGYPLALAVGGIVLGYRRGYDWVTLLICLAVYLLWPLVATVITAGDFQNYVTDWGMALIAFFIPATQIGMLIGLLIRHLTRSAG